jgi:hypothetical protein
LGGGHIQILPHRYIKMLQNGVVKLGAIDLGNVAFNLPCGVW